MQGWFDEPTPQAHPVSLACSLLILPRLSYFPHTQGGLMDTYDPTRRFGRVPVALPVIGWAPQFQGTALSGVVLYLGEGGMMVEFPVQLTRGTSMRVFLPTFQGPVEVEGTVMWTASHGSVIRHGVAFPDPKGPDFIQRVLGEKR
jgi:hypothetical protein